MNFEKKNNIYKSIMLIAVTAMVTFLITSIGIYNYYIKTENGLAKTLITTETTALDTKVQLIREYLNELYLGDISNEEELIESAIKESDEIRTDKQTSAAYELVYKSDIFKDKYS